ncbi:MAG: hypothetical protein RJQ09_08280 [Cyclobacteriaceae bacterium]
MEDFILKLQNSIEELTIWGTDEIKTSNASRELEYQLIRVYHLYFEARQLKETIEVVTSPDFDQTKIRKRVMNNIPEIGTYQIVSNMEKSIDEVEIITADAIDDLSVIIYELLVIKWHLKNSKPGEVLWHFIFSFDHHIRQHLTALIFYLTRKA